MRAVPDNPADSLPTWRSCSLLTSKAGPRTHTYLCVFNRAETDAFHWLARSMLT